MNLRGIGDDHPDGPDEIRDLVWMTSLHGLTRPQEELPEELLFERPPQDPLAYGFDAKLNALEMTETTQDCE